MALTGIVGTFRMVGAFIGNMAGAIVARDDGDEQEHVILLPKQK